MLKLTVIQIYGCYIIMILNYLYGENVNNLSLTDFYDYLEYLEKYRN